jgi:TadE-like protein
MIDMAAGIRSAQRRLGRWLTHGSAGQSVVEFAVALPFLVFMGVGTFAVGIIIDRHLTVGQLVRNGGNMFARGVSFASNQNKQFLVDAADGMGMTLNGGNAVVYLTLLERVPATAQCGGGTCANAGRIVIAQRFSVGNSTLAPSKFGMPTQLDSEGNHLDAFGDTDARATNVPASLNSVSGGLQPNEIVYVVESFHKPSTITFPGLFSPQMMYSRAFF